ncbi:MAG: Calx-beta domain-containing protein [Panacagrimonas sp.]
MRLAERPGRDAVHGNAGGGGEVTPDRRIEVKPGETPQGLKSHEWASIQAQIEQSRYRLEPSEHSVSGANPEQGWKLEFDARGLRLDLSEPAKSDVRPIVGRFKPVLSGVEGPKAEPTLRALQDNPLEFDEEGLNLSPSIRSVRAAHETPSLEHRRGHGPLLPAPSPVGAGQPRDRLIKGTPDEAGLRLTTTAIGRVDALTPVPGAAPVVRDNRVELHHAQATEWYVNSALGLEHGYTFDHAPRGERGEVRIELAVEGGLKAQPTADGVTLTDASGAQRMRYHKLVVLDANKQKLEARLEVQADDRLQIAFDDTYATYPVIVDPLLVNEEAKLTVAGDGSTGDQFGNTSAIDGDTLIVAAPEYGTSSQGSAYIFVRSGSVWTQQAKLSATDIEPGDNFGGTVHVSGNTALVGAVRDDAPANEQGSVYVFVRSGTVWTQQAKLTASDGAAGDLFGYALSISGDTALIGAVFDDNPGSDQGSAYVFVRTGAVWTQQAKLSASDGAANDNFGTAVAVSGDTVIVGAFQDDNPSSDQGSAYVFVRSGSAWTQQAKLSANDGAGGDFFGFAVAVSSDTAVIGAFFDDSPNGNQGSAYVFVRSGVAWTQQAKLTASDGAANDFFGRAVALSGDTAVVGAPLDDSPAGDQGSAYVFVRSGTIWTQQAKLTAGDGAAGDRLGYLAVGISGDTVLVAADLDDNPGVDQGSAYVFTRSAGSWSQQAKLSAAEGAAGDQLGTSVSVSGDTAVVGAPNDDIGTNSDQGSAYVFVRTASGWSEQARLIASDGAPGDLFGFNVAVSGDTAVLGAFRDDHSDSDQGSAYVFVRSGTSWTQQQKLVASDGARGDVFGYSVAVSGETVVVGAIDDDVGANINQGSAYVFVRSGTSWAQQAKLVAADGAVGDFFGGAVSVFGHTAVIGAFGDDIGANGNQGSAYAFVRAGVSWSLQAKLVAADGAPGVLFGGAVGVSGDTAVIGAVLDDIGGNLDQGAAYVFVRSGSTWTQQAKLVAADGAPADQFGESVAVSGDVAVAGARADIDGRVDQGSAYVFLRSGSIWTQQTKLVASDGAASDGFGIAVAASGETLVIGAPRDDNASGGDAGAAYIYRIASDYGDAPDPTYPTLLANDGARHFLNGPKLGTAIDPETDGQPNPGATGDDIAGIDDEDGVEFGTLVSGQSATVDVEVTDGPALLDAWIDFNRDGDWSDAGEQIFDDYIVLNGANNGLVFQVPGTAVAGISYARVRLSSDGVAEPTGAAPDGEVEDEQVNLVTAMLSVADADVSEGDSGTGSLSFTVSLSNASSDSVFVDYATSNGTATTADADYAASTGTLEFTPGQISKTVSVPVNGDTKFELDETLTLTLSSPMGATISDGSATGTILNDDAEPSIRFTQGTRTVIESAGTVNLDVELSNPSYLPVSIEVTGSPPQGADYTALTAGPITIPAGATSAAVSLTVTEDAIDEADEIVNISLTSPVNATLGSPSTLALTIEDNDGAPTVSFTDATLSFDEGAGTVTSRVQLSAASGQDVTVPVMLTGGTAVGADYALLTATPVNIPAGETFVDLSIQITDDLLDEADETITLQLGAPTNATITAPFTQSITIVDNDATPSVSFDTAGASYDEAAGTVMIPVRLSATSGQLVTAEFSAGGSATAADFDVPTTSPLSFPLGSTAVNIVLEVSDDALDEIDETVLFTLTSASNATLGANPGFTATIEDNDDAPAVAFELTSRGVLENAGTVTVDVVLSAASGKDVSFAFDSGGSASAADYSGLTASPVNILAGSTRASLSISVTDDALDEPDETLILTLLSAINASVGVPADFTLTVQDNDDAPTVSFTVDVSSANESDGTVTAIAQLSGPSAFDVTVPFSVTGTAGGLDFTLLSASPLMIPAGATQATVSVSLLEDALDEEAETIAISLQAATKATVTAPSTHTITILDNDTAPSVSFTLSTQNVAESAGTAMVALQLSAVSGKVISVPLSFGGSAVAPGDYSASASSVAIPAGGTGGSFTLNIVNDTAFESPDETIVVTAGSPTNASLGSPSSQTITVVDNDGQAVATISLAPATATLPTLTQHCVTATTRDSVGTALSSIPLSFTVTGVNPTTGSATTNGTGTAPFCFTGVNAGTDSIKASFMSLMGTASVTWTKRNTVLKADPVPAVIVTQGLQILIRLSPRATLRDVATNAPIAGRTVNFTAGTTGSTALCTAVTNASGVATCQATVANSLGAILSLGYTARFNGDTTYNPSSGKGDVLGLTLF